MAIAGRSARTSVSFDGMVSDDMIMRPSREAAAGPDLSVVAPLYNESQNVAPLVEWILQALAEYSGRFEVILVDDGSRDDTWGRVVAASIQDARVHGLRLGRNVGQTAAMMAGFDPARGRVVVSLDGDLQNDPRPGLRMAPAASGQVPAAEGAVVGGEPDHPPADWGSDHR